MSGSYSCFCEYIFASSYCFKPYYISRIYRFLRYDKTKTIVVIFPLKHNLRAGRLEAIPVFEIICIKIVVHTALNPTLVALTVSEL